MMKLILTDHEDHSEVKVMDGCQLMHTYTFDDHKQARAFCTGFQCAKSVINGLVQSLPIGHYQQTTKPDKKSIHQQALSNYLISG